MTYHLSHQFWSNYDREQEAAQRPMQMEWGGLSNPVTNEQIQCNKTHEPNLVAMESPGNQATITANFNREVEVKKLGYSKQNTGKAKTRIPYLGSIQIHRDESGNQCNSRYGTNQQYPAIMTTEIINEHVFDLGEKKNREDQVGEQMHPTGMEEQRRKHTFYPFGTRYSIRIEFKPGNHVRIRESNNSAEEYN